MTIFQHFQAPAFPSSLYQAKWYFLGRDRVKRQIHVLHKEALANSPEICSQLQSMKFYTA